MWLIAEEPRRHRGRSGLSVNMAAGFLAIILVLIIARIANTYNVRELYRTSDGGPQARHSYVRTLETGFVATGVELFLVIALIVAAWRSGKDRLRAHEAAERLSVTLSSIGDGIVVTDRHARINRLNGVAEALTGWKQTEAVGRPIDEVLTLLNEQSRDRVDNPVESVLRTGVISHLANHTILVPRSGREIPIDDSAAPIKTPDGRITGVVMVFRDITEQRRAEAERAILLERANDARAEAERANRAKDEFLAMLSHELRTPLGSIVGWSQVLKSGDLPPEKAQYALQAIIRGAETETHLVDSLLDLSRIKSGKIHLDLKHVELSQIVAAAVDTVQHAAQAKRIALELSRVPSPAILVNGDADRLQQIMWNLLSNAIKFTPENGRIQIRLSCAAANAVIEVCDNGRGIRADFLSRIFDRFTQDYNGGPERHAGLGLGLAIVRGLVEAHHGTIDVASDGEGLGSTFIVSLPAVSARSLPQAGTFGLF
jgi:PAS domain S-box-containing protein